MLTLLVLAPEAEASAVSVAGYEVMGMMDRIPGKPGDGPRGAPYAWSEKPGAPAVARAVATTAPDRTWAARMTVYAVLESGLELCAEGDGGKSLGPWQLQRAPREVACDPARAAAEWLARARQSESDCALLPRDERLAELVSGSCTNRGGRKLARWREVMVLSALGPGGVD